MCIQHKTYQKVKFQHIHSRVYSVYSCIHSEGPSSVRIQLVKPVIDFRDWELRRLKFDSTNLETNMRGKVKSWGLGTCIPISQMQFEYSSFCDQCSRNSIWSVFSSLWQAVVSWRVLEGVSPWMSAKQQTYRICLPCPCSQHDKETLLWACACTSFESVCVCAFTIAWTFRCDLEKRTSSTLCLLYTSTWWSLIFGQTTMPPILSEQPHLPPCFLPRDAFCAAWSSLDPFARANVAVRDGSTHSAQIFFSTKTCAPAGCEHAFYQPFPVSFTANKTSAHKKNGSGRWQSKSTRPLLSCFSQKSRWTCRSFPRSSG